MEIFQNNNDLGDSNNKTFIRRYTYEMQHSSFYIAKELSTFCNGDIIKNVKRRGVYFEKSEIKSNCICNSNSNSKIIKTSDCDISSFVKNYENIIQKLNDENKYLKIELQKKEEEITKLKNNLSSESLIFMSNRINNFKNFKEQIEIQEAQKTFLEDMRKKSYRINKINEKIKKLREKEIKNSNMEDDSEENKITAIQEKELKEEIKIKFKKISKENQQKIENFRKEYELKKEDFSDEDLFNALYRNNYNFSNAFGSLFLN